MGYWAPKDLHFRSGFPGVDGRSLFGLLPRFNLPLYGNVRTGLPFRNRSLVRSMARRFSPDHPQASLGIGRASFPVLDSFGVFSPLTSPLFFPASVKSLLFTLYPLPSLLRPNTFFQCEIVPLLPPLYTQQASPHSSEPYRR